MLKTAPRQDGHNAPEQNGLFQAFQDISKMMKNASICFARPVFASRPLASGLPIFRLPGVRHTARMWKAGDSFNTV